ncbi:MAG TPA: SGNH/GDSL hydrolase family protein [Armatimonadota bacterium]
MASQQGALTRTGQLLREKKAVRVVCYGDSISTVEGRWFGGAKSKEAIWGEQLGVLLRKAYPESDIQVINLGVPGQNAYEGLGRITTLAEVKPDLVLVAFGANDCCYHFLQPEETGLALKTLAEWIKERFAADVMIVGTAGDNPVNPFFVHLDATVQASRKAAEEVGVPFVDMRAAALQWTEQGTRWIEFFNGNKNCHPNDTGHRAWAEVVLGAIQQAVVKK